MENATHAFTDKAGYRHYTINGKLHRLDGPAIICPDGYKFWYFQGKHIDVYSQEEFERYLKLKAFW